MLTCKFCGCSSCEKAGSIRGKKRYKCLRCRRHQVEGDGRNRFDKEVLRISTILYLEGLGFRQIVRIFKAVSHRIISLSALIRNMKKLGIESLKIQQKSTPIEVCEMDELYTYVKKKTAELEYGLLLIGTDSVLVHVKSAQEQGKFVKDSAEMSVKKSKDRLHGWSFFL